MSPSLLKSVFEAMIPHWYSARPLLDVSMDYIESLKLNSQGFFSNQGPEYKHAQGGLGMLLLDGLGSRFADAQDVGLSVTPLELQKFRELTRTSGFIAPDGPSLEYGDRLACLTVNNLKSNLPSLADVGNAYSISAGVTSGALFRRQLTPANQKLRDGLLYLVQDERAYDQSPQTTCEMFGVDYRTATRAYGRMKELLQDWATHSDNKTQQQILGIQKKFKFGSDEVVASTRDIVTLTQDSTQPLSTSRVPSSKIANLDSELSYEGHLRRALDAITHLANSDAPFSIQKKEFCFQTGMNEAELFGKEDESGIRERTSRDGITTIYKQAFCYHALAVQQAEAHHVKRVMGFSTHGSALRARDVFAQKVEQYLRDAKLPQTHAGAPFSWRVMQNVYRNHKWGRVPIEKLLDVFAPYVDLQPEEIKQKGNEVYLVAARTTAVKIASELIKYTDDEKKAVAAGKKVEGRKFTQNEIQEHIIPNHDRSLISHMLKDWKVYSRLQTWNSPAKLRNKKSRPGINSTNVDERQAQLSLEATVVA